MNNSKENDSKQVKLGAILSYTMIIANTIFGLIVTPFILRALGSTSYGVYKTINSFTSSMMVLDFGLGGTVMRYLAKYRVNKENEKIRAFVSMAFIEAGILIMLVLLISSIYYFNISTIYGKSFTYDQLELAHKLFLLLSIGIVFHIVENVFNGIITGYNYFIYGNGIKVVRITIRMFLIYLFLSRTKSAITLVLIDLLIIIVTIIADYFYVKIKCGLHIRIKISDWNRHVFRESFIYTFFAFLTSIAAQINSNLDNVVIGAIKGAEYVTVYSFGITIFGMYEQFSTSISGVMLPTVTKKLSEDKNGKEIQKLIIRVGRVQFLLLGAAVAGFLIMGKQFIYLWLGDGFEDVYIIVLILIIPSLFELCVNVCLAILRAKNMMGFRTGVLFSTTALNLIITIWGVKHWNYIAAAVGTATSFIVGSLIIMNIYYYKQLGLKMLSIYFGIFKGILSSLIVSGLALLVSCRFINTGWHSFVINVFIFCAVYLITLIMWGFNDDDYRLLPFKNKLACLRMIIHNK